MEDAPDLRSYLVGTVLTWRVVHLCAQVREYYLEDALEMTGFEVSPASECLRKPDSNRSDRKGGSGAPGAHQSHRRRWLPCIKLCVWPVPARPEAAVVP